MATKTDAAIEMSGQPATEEHVVIFRLADEFYALDIQTVQFNRTERGRLDQTCYHEQGGLAGPAWSNDSGDFARADSHVGLIQRNQRLSAGHVVFADAGERQRGRRCQASTSRART